MRQRFCSIQNRFHGYTLVEVMVVVVVMGIAGAIVVPSMMDQGQMGVQAAVRIVIADVLYAQNEAITQGSAREVRFSPATEAYELTTADGTRIQSTLAGGGGQNYRVDFTQDTRFRGVQIESADFGGDPTLSYDDLGTPASGGTIVLTYNNIRFQISVAAFTGRVTVQEL